MAYTSSTSVTTLDNFITAFCSFAVSYAGFTDEGTFTESSTTVRIISKGGLYWSFYSLLHPSYYYDRPANIKSIVSRITYTKPTTIADIYSVVLTAYWAGGGGLGGCYFPTKTTVWRNTAGPYIKYYLYTEGTCVHCVLEVYNNIFTHLSFGDVTKLGTWVGGEYIAGNATYYETSEDGTGSFSNFSNRDSFYFTGSTTNSVGSFWQYSAHPYCFPGYIRHIIGSAYNDYRDFARIGIIEENLQKCKMGVRSDYLTNLIDYTPNNFNLRGPSLPMYTPIFDTTRDEYGLMGYIPEVKVVNVQNIPPGDIVETDYQAFPVTQRGTPDLTLASGSGNWGLMYKRTAPAV